MYRLSKIILFTAAKPVSCHVDLVLLAEMDSRSTDYALVRSFLSQLVFMIDFDSGNTRLFYVTYDSKRTDHNFSFEHQHWILDSLQKYILTNWSNVVKGKGPKTGFALQGVRHSEMSSKRGDRSNVPTIVLLVYGGHSSNQSAAQVSGQLFFCYLIISPCLQY